MSTPPIAVCDASVTTVYGNFGFGNYRIGTVHKASFKSWNALCWYGPHCHGMSFLINFVRGFATCGVVLHKPPVVVGKSQEGQDIMYIP